MVRISGFLKYLKYLKYLIDKRLLPIKYFKYFNYLRNPEIRTI